MDKFPSAVFKKFASEQDAWAFVRSQSAAPSFGRTKGNIKGASFKMADVPYTPLIKIRHYASSGFQVYKRKCTREGGLRCHPLN